MDIPISFQGNFHWIDRINIKVYPLEVSGKSKQLVKIMFYSKGKSFNDGEITAYTDHKFVEMKAEVKKNLTSIWITKKEGKNDRNNKKRRNKKAANL